MLVIPILSLTFTLSNHLPNPEIITELHNISGHPYIFTRYYLKILLYITSFLIEDLLNSSLSG